MYQKSCGRCGSTSLYTETKGKNVGLYCGDCGAWQKWVTKDELRAFEYNQAKESRKNTNWFPYNGKLPDDGQVVIGCKKSGFITRYQFKADDPPCWIDEHGEFFPLDEIIAWMPLPEP